VEGGSGAVSWSVSDSDVAVVTIKGEVMAGKRRGQVDIQASDARNPLHTATGQEEENQAQDPPQGSSGPQTLLEVTDCSLINLHVTTEPQGVFTPLP
ncbi:unnamed protein product, partial [Coregonus sp. 'balchen']